MAALQEIVAQLLEQIPISEENASEVMPTPVIVRRINDAFQNLALRAAKKNPHLLMNDTTVSLVNNTWYDDLPDDLSLILGLDDPNDNAIEPISFHSRMSRRGKRGFLHLSGRLKLMNATSGSYNLRYRRSPGGLHYGVCSVKDLTGVSGTATNESTSLTGVTLGASDTAYAIGVGQTIGGTNIASGAVVTAAVYDSAAETWTVTMDLAATGSGAVADLTFTSPADRIYLSTIAGSHTGPMMRGNDAYIGMHVALYDGEGEYQTDRLITDSVKESNGSPGYCLVTPDWDIIPDETTHYSIRPFWPSEYDDALLWESILRLPVDAIAAKADRPALANSVEMLMEWAADTAVEGGNFGRALSNAISSSLGGVSPE